MEIPRTLARVGEGTAGSSGELSVYLHVPFCVAKCPYCDFYSAPMDRMGVEPARYFDLVGRELEILCEGNKSLPSSPLVTLYVGGGTPSLIEPALYRRFFERLGHTFEIEPSLEWTLESNPGTVSSSGTGLLPVTDHGQDAHATSLDEFLALGVNRFSIGVQSFCDETLERLGRSHRSGENRALLDRLRGNSLPNTGWKPVLPANLAWAIDLIFAVPGQTLEQWQRDLDAAIAYRPHHISVYGLTVHEGTPFGDLQRAGRLDLPDEEVQREMFLLARRRLLAAGYEHYEISNYALPGFRSRHNERYWTGGDYLGLGVSAHSLVGGMRWANPPDIAHYCRSLEAGILPRRIEPPPEGRARLGEQVMLGLRRLEGIDVATFRSRLGADLTETYASEIARLVEVGLVELVEGRLRLTEEGLLVADAVMAEFF